ncbi:MAG: metallophosphoesterase family protein, partial [Solirubrobacteraceae bacterium]
SGEQRRTQGPAGVRRSCPPSSEEHRTARPARGPAGQVVAQKPPRVLSPAPMGPLAILYDVHGNLPALDAVLADACGAGAARFLLGGDYALFGPWPAETVAALRALTNSTWIRGNVDRWSAHPPEAPGDELVQDAIAACRDALSPRLIDELGALPEQVVLDGTRYCHASPISDLRSFAPDQSDEDDELLGDTRERRVVFGHTHVQFVRGGPAGAELVNPGSVGMPFDGDPRAAYGLLHDDGRLELRRVGYDHGASAAAMRRRFGDAAWVRRGETRLTSARA